MCVLTSMNIYQHFNIALVAGKLSPGRSPLPCFLVDVVERVVLPLAQGTSGVL